MARPADGITRRHKSQLVKLYPHRASPKRLCDMKPGFLALTLTLTLLAQTRPAFEAVSIHENPGPWRLMRNYAPSGSHLMLGGWRIGDLFQEAYALKPYH